MIIFSNETNAKISSKTLDFLNQILDSMLDSNKNIELILIDSKKMQALNKKFLNKNYATDVLSFPLDSALNGALLGSVVINIDLAREISKKLKHSLKNELAILFTHGILHILGYDHEKDNGKHRKKESEILQKFNIKGLIERNNM